MWSNLVIIPALFFLEIIDFKTDNERRLEEELHLQVQLYTAVAREALDLNVKKAFIHFLDIKKQTRVKVSTTPNNWTMQ